MTLTAVLIDCRGVNLENQNPCSTDTHCKQGSREAVLIRGRAYVQAPAWCTD